MGGKAKQKQRTKNNTKPSNSGRSAELLATSASRNFIGFANVAQMGLIPTVLHDSSNNDSVAPGDDIDSLVDVNYQLVLRKMAKKDPITKVKALQEFGDLVSKTEAAAIKSILPFWPRLYNNLANDVEHRVREATQQAHAAIAGQAGKNIAPFLKQIGPMWIMSQYDMYAPAASIATHSFQKSFPMHRQQDVYNFCHSELLESITKNLTILPASTSPEYEAKHYRILFSSLKAYASYLKNISESNLEKSLPANVALWESEKFWAYQRNDNAHVRNAWFIVIGQLLQTSIDLTKYQKKIAIATLLHIDEKETVVLPAIWAAVLLTMKKFENWHTHISMDKAFLPKLWKLLKSAGHGSAEIIYPHFLPLISNWKFDIFGEKLFALYENFLQNLCIGLRSELEKKSSSRSEIKAISVAYFECIKYILLSVQMLSSDAFDANTTSETFSLKLIQSNVIDTIEFLLENPQQGRCVLPHLVDLVHFWCQSSDTNKLHATFENHFWVNAYNSTENGLANFTENGGKLEIVQEMIQIMFKTGENNGRAKTNKIKFSDDGNGVGDEVDGVLKTKQSLDRRTLFRARTMDFVVKLCQLFIKNTSSTPTKHYLPLLETFFTHFAGEIEFFDQIAGSRTEIHRLCEQFCSWLDEESIRSESVLNMALILNAYLKSEEKIQMLEKLVQSEHGDVADWVVLRLLTHPFCTEPEVQRLITDTAVTANIIKNATTLTTANVRTKMNLLYKCFFQMDSGKFLIDARTCDQIIECLCDVLNATGTDIAVLDACVKFLARIMPAICCDEQKNAIRNKMFVHLFGLCVDQTRLSTLDEGTVWEALASWEDTLSCGDIQLDESLLESCADAIERNVTALVADAHSTIDVFSCIAEVVSNLVLCSVEKFKGDDEFKSQHIDNMIALIFNKFEAQYSSLRAASVHASTFVELISGRIKATPTVISWLDSTRTPSNIFPNAHSLVKLAYFKFQTVFKITCIARTEDIPAEAQKVDNAKSADIDEELTEDYCDLKEVLLKQWTQQIYAEIGEAIYLFGLFSSHVKHFKLPDSVESSFTSYLVMVNEFLDNISESRLDEIIAKHTISEKLINPFVMIGAQIFGDVGWNFYEEASDTMLFNLFTANCNEPEKLDEYLTVVLAYALKLPERQIPISTNLLQDAVDSHRKSIGLRCLLVNYFKNIFNEPGDQVIVTECTRLIDDLYNQSKENRALFMYDTDLSTANPEEVFRLVDYMHYLGDVLRYSFANITKTGWDFIRIALSSWVLSASKSATHWKMPHVGIFVAKVYDLFAILSDAIDVERKKSSTHLLKEVIDEWDQIFAKDVNLILLKCYRGFVESADAESDTCQEFFFDILSQSITRISYKYFMIAEMRKIAGGHLEFAIDQLTNKYHAVRMAAARIIGQLSKSLIEADLEQSNRTEQNKTTADGHLLHKFRPMLQQQSDWAQQYINEFTFKLTELDEFSAIPTYESLSFLLMWHCILNICQDAPSEVRSTYATFITEEKFDDPILQMLFRMMPIDVLRNPDNKSSGAPFFDTPYWFNIQDNNVTPEHYACHIYKLTLKFLPAMVRKWWTNSQARQKSQVDKITTAFVSTHLCADEFRTLLDKKGNKDAFQIAVHSSTREIHATYTVDEARMELIIQLPLNYPLGAVKVSCGKQIGDKLQSKAVVMQLSIFLTHQNGSIWDGLTLWKRDLDRKFEGVEECYVCYGVIHQETCQLPKLSCKTCKKKFHGQCLYKWFNTSNKSTCPICRNIF